MHSVHDPTLRGQNDRVLKSSFMNALRMFRDPTAGRLFVAKPGHFIKCGDAGNRDALHWKRLRKYPQATGVPNPLRAVFGNMSKMLLGWVQKSIDPAPVATACRGKAGRGMSRFTVGQGGRRKGKSARGLAHSKTLSRDPFVTGQIVLRESPFVLKSHFLANFTDWWEWREWKGGGGGGFCAISEAYAYRMHRMRTRRCQRHIGGPRRKIFLRPP